MLKKVVFTVLMGVFILLACTVDAQAFAVTEYVNPQAVVIAAPEDGYTTTGDAVSILGACDYRYPLYMNGELVETTAHGFFTCYVQLELGENIFNFENNGRRASITIVRRKSTGTGGGTEPEYIEYPEGTYGRVTSKYAMTRGSIYAQSPQLIPITENTQVRLLGEQGNFYKIYDGSFVSKSSIEKHETSMPENVIDRIYMQDDTDKNIVRLVFDMTVNVPFKLSTLEDGTFSLKIYETQSAPCVEYIRNNTIRKVAVKRDQGEGYVELIITLKDAYAKITGYDSEYEDGKLIVYLKKAPQLEGVGNLKGAVVLLDAGHGEDDMGAVGPMGTLGPTEKDFNLNIMLYAAQFLRERGAEVVVTREDDTFLSLSERVELIRQLQPDISVSVHGNSIPYETDYSRVSGFLTYYTYSFTGSVPERINSLVAAEMGFEVSEPQRKSLSLTRLTTCPAMLLETLFLSNPQDYEFLILTANQKKYGQSIADAIEKYIKEDAVYPGMRKLQVKRYGY